MLYALFDASGRQVNLADDQRLTNENWIEVPGNIDFDPSAERLMLVDGVLQKEPIPPYVDPPTYRLYGFIADFEGDRTKTPKNIIFPEQLDTNLPKRSFVSLGERRKSLYFANPDFTDPVIKVEYVFNRDAEGYLINKVRTISYRLTDGSWSLDTKALTIPVASQTEKLQEIKTRRRNIIDELKGMAAQLKIEDRILEIFTRFQLEENLYVETGSDALYVAIEKNADIEWLSELLPSPSRAPARAALLRHLAIGLIKQSNSN